VLVHGTCWGKANFLNFGNFGFFWGIGVRLHGLHGSLTVHRAGRGAIGVARSSTCAAINVVSIRN
jgi:hypothetical protein